MSRAPVPNRASEPDPRRVRIGLIIVTVVFVVALVLFAVIGDAFGRLVLAGVLLTAVIRAYLLRRTIRRGRQP